MSTPIPTRLTIVYRSTDAENGKPRPHFYGKDLALASILRAAEALPTQPRLVFLNDGVLPAERLALMRRHGHVRRIVGGSNRATFRTAVARQAALCTGDRELVWFAEDDYLYRPDALSSLMAAATAFPEADYFALYGSDALDTASPWHRPAVRPEPGAEGDPDARAAGSVQWFRAQSTTSTFGVRARALRADAALLRRMPFAGGAWDTATCLALQGYLPFPRPDLLPQSDGVTARTLIRAAVRIAADVGAAARLGGRRVLVGADPELVHHMEVHDGRTRTSPSAATLSTDWRRTAEETRAWAVDRAFVIAG
ncbi:hypothetical protein GCM10017691_19350 [Pseudonocardia petroleophila]|uniref:Glycosyl transferase family 2 n=1 Tax=Pseudonocardia petroleophila TaxID=37331 RepID=A0A7G7MGY3_9PSEU|nr:hypothetical protein [Pseudonocardia petroleophila]QNG52044.1 hypothetical protein H6H00_28930 [Pseudonocardia petroleophila]